VRGGVLLGAIPPAGERRDPGTARRRARQHSRRRRRDPGGRGAATGGAQEGADRRVARGAGGGPPAGAAHVGEHDVRHGGEQRRPDRDRKSTRLNSSHVKISYAVFCLKKKNIIQKVKNASDFYKSCKTNCIMLHLA